MTLRGVLQANDSIATDTWAKTNFDLISSKNSPSISIEIEDGGQVSALKLDSEATYTIGSKPHQCNITLDHPSVDNFHAMIIVDKCLGVIVVDLGTRDGTFLSKDRLDAFSFKSLNDNSILQFGQCK